MQHTWSNDRHPSFNISPNSSPCLPDTTNTNLIDKVLNMIYAERLFTIDDPIQIGFHEVANYVHILEIFVRTGRKNVQDSNNVVMLNLSKQLNLS